MCDLNYKDGWNSKILEFETRVSIPLASYPREKGCGKNHVKFVETLQEKTKMKIWKDFACTLFDEF